MKHIAINAKTEAKLLKAVTGVRKVLRVAKDNDRVLVFMARGGKDERSYDICVVLRADGTLGGWNVPENAPSVRFSPKQWEVVQGVWGWGEQIHGSAVDRSPAAQKKLKAALRALVKDYDLGVAVK